MTQNNTSFKAYKVEEINNKFIGSIQQISFKTLNDNEILVKVKYSSLNYKDALSATGNKGVTKNYPHIPGIDAVGIVEKSNSKKYNKGDFVIVTSYDLGMNTHGGFGEYIQVPDNWAVKLPKTLTTKEAMILGTAGLTAGMSVLKLTELIKPSDGKIVVSGATGGVGSLSVAILSKLGYEITAITGKESEIDYLMKLGAKEIILRKDFDAPEKRPLLKSNFAGAIDTVGGTILENIIKQTKPNGVVTCCGNVASPTLNLTVFPFILRGINLMGIDSQNLAMDYRNKVWQKLADEWKPTNLLKNFTEITLNELDDKIQQMLKGNLKGRTIIKIAD